MHFAIFVACLVANILANRACSLRLSNIFIATSIFVYNILPNFTFSGTFVNDILQSSAWGYYLQDYKILSQLIIGVLSFTITPIFTFGRASVGEIQ